MTHLVMGYFIPPIKLTTVLTKYIDSCIYLFRRSNSYHDNVFNVDSFLISLGTIRLNILDIVYIYCTLKEKLVGYYCCI